MNRTKCTVALALLLLASPALGAEPLPPELNLIPRDAGMFASVRVADLWDDARVKPLRDFLAKDANLLREFEKDNGFRPEDVERVTILVPGFDGRHGPAEPCFVLTFKKPHDLAKLLDAWHGMSPAEYRRFEDERRMIPQPGKGFPKGFPDAPPIPKGFPVPPKFIEKDFPPPKLIEKDLPPPKDFFPKGESPVIFLAQDDPPAKKNSKRDLKSSYYYLRDRGFLIPINERTFVMCRFRGHDASDSVHDLLAALLRRSDDGALSQPLETAAGKHAAVVGFNLRALRDGLPRETWVEVLPVHSILASRSATFTLDMGDEIKLALRVDSPDAATSKRVHDVLKAFHTLGMEMLPGLKKLADEDKDPGIKLLLSVAEPLLRDVVFEQQLATVTASTKLKADAAWATTLADAIDKVREAAARATSQNNLKQMGLAVHNFHDAMGRFPFPGATAPKGQPQAMQIGPKPNLSWRVAILPYIEQGNLYNQFRFDEPWDSDHNKKLIPMMPKIYAAPASVEVEKGHTFYRMFTGQSTFSAAQTFAAVADGTSNTIMVLEAGEVVPWTKPDEMPYGEKLPKLGGHFKGKMNVLLGDGSVRTIDLKSISDATLRAAITTNGGEVLGSDW